MTRRKPSNPIFSRPLPFPTNCAHRVLLNNGEDRSHLIDARTYTGIADENETTDQLPAAKRQKALKNFQWYPAEYRCTAACKFGCIQDLSLSLAAMSVKNRLNSVRSILLVVTAPAGEDNQLAEWNSDYAQNQRQKQRSNNDTPRIKAHLVL